MKVIITVTIPHTVSYERGGVLERCIKYEKCFPKYAAHLWLTEWKQNMKKKETFDFKFFLIHTNVTEI